MTSSQQMHTEGQATYGMANLRPERTGLPFIVFISQRGEARQAARVKVSPAPKVVKEAMGAYAIAPFGYEAGTRLGAREETLLEGWIDRNSAVLQDYWDGVIEYTEDAIARLQPAPASER